MFNTLELIHMKFFCGGNIDNQKVPWIALDKILASNDCGVSTLVLLKYKILIFLVNNDGDLGFL